MTQQRILIVDDSEHDRRLARRQFDGEDVRIDEARNLPEALALLERGSEYDMIVLDLNLPGIGKDKLQALKSLGRYRIPITVLGADNPAPQIRQGVESLGADYIEKRQLSQSDILITQFLQALDKKSSSGGKTGQLTAHEAELARQKIKVEQIQKDVEAVKHGMTGEYQTLQTFLQRLTNLERDVVGLRKEVEKFVNGFQKQGASLNTLLNKLSKKVEEIERRMTADYDRQESREERWQGIVAGLSFLFAIIVGPLLVSILGPVVAQWFKK